MDGRRDGHHRSIFQGHRIWPEYQNDYFEKSYRYLWGAVSLCVIPFAWWPAWFRRFSCVPRGFGPDGSVCPRLSAPRSPISAPSTDPANFCSSRDNPLWNSQVLEMRILSFFQSSHGINEFLSFDFESYFFHESSARWTYYYYVFNGPALYSSVVNLSYFNSEFHLTDADSKSAFSIAKSVKIWLFSEIFIFLITEFQWFQKSVAPAGCDPY